MFQCLEHKTQEKFENGVFTPKTHQMLIVHTTSEKFEDGDFTLKTHLMFSVHAALTPEKLEEKKTPQQSPVTSGLPLRKTPAGK